ncbi:unnamed protein product, partial [Rotaria magnacalcarata]
IVKWEHQRREILVTEGDSVDKIDQTIFEAFGLQPYDNLYEYQVQFYHQQYKTFIYLYEKTSDEFQKLVHELSIRSANHTKGKEWCLMVVPKMAQVIPDGMDLGDVQTQTENESSHFQANTTQNSFLQNNTGKSFYSNRQQSDYLPIKDAQLIQTSIRFSVDLGNKQRFQYASDAITRKDDGKLSFGGCFLKGVRQETMLVKCEIHPTVDYQIFNDNDKLLWRIRRFALITPDSERIYYQHPPKTIIDAINLQKLNDKDPNSSTESSVISDSLVNSLTSDLEKEVSQMEYTST